MKKENVIYGWKRERLAEHEKANCYTLKKDDEIILVSYTTPVIYLGVKNGSRTVECTGLYSMTTRKHINYFLRQYAKDLSYYDIKKIAGMGEYEM